MLALAAARAAALAAAADAPPVVVEAGAPVARAAPALSGLGIEDANHQLYGGLWSQMVFGESFEEPAGPDGASGSAPWLVYAIPGCFGTSQGPTWSAVGGKPAVVSGGHTGNQSQRLPPGAAVENGGLLGAGMYWQQGKSYEGSVYVRPAAAGTARLAISATAGGVPVATAIAEGPWVAGSWQRVPFTLVPNASATCPLSAPSPNHTGTCNDAHALTGCVDGCVSSPELGARCVACTGGLRLGVEQGSTAALDIDQVTVMPGKWGRYRGLPVRKDLGDLSESATVAPATFSTRR